MFQRTIQLEEAAREKSLFLLGPRQTGKSTLLKRQFPKALFLDLLSPPLFRQLIAHPEHLEQLTHGANETVIIDEIQNIPDLLNVVHHLIEARPTLRFILTGSSARKLRKGGVNLLGGRARLHHLYPITTKEMETSPASNLTWKTILECGGLPSILTSPSPQEDLDAYVGLYLREEIQAEAAVRSLPDFSRFLTVAGSRNGQQINFERVASDVGVSAKVIHSYFQILSDTLIAELLPSFQHSSKRKAVATPKCFFFDIGVANNLRGISKVPIGSETFGNALEHLVFLELKAQRGYSRLRHEITYWRTTSHFEVDFILSNGKNLVAIEVKGTESPDRHDLKGLRAFHEEFPAARRILVCQTAFPRTLEDNVEVLPAEHFFSMLWAGKINPTSAV